MSIVLLLVSLALLMFLCFKGVPIFISAFLSGILLLVTAGLNPINLMVSTYATGLGNYFGNYFFIFVLGALFGKMTEITGAADSIAKAVVNKLGDKFIVPALMVAGLLLTYGGVSVFVCFFTLYPMMVSMFQRANLPRYLMPAVYFAGAGTVTGWAPGSPQIQNLVPGRVLGTAANSSMGPGIAGVIFELILVFAFMGWVVSRAQKRGDGYQITPRDQEVLGRIADKKTPHWLLALLPMIIMLVVLNLSLLDELIPEYRTEFALFVGVVATLLCYAQFIPWKDVFKHLGDGTTDGTRALFSTSAVVGFGSLVQATDAFQGAVDLLTSNTSGNMLLMATIAVTVLAGICGSGSGGQGIAMPILAEYFVPLGVDTAALHRMSALASLGLDSLPHNGLVVSVLTMSGVSHREGYKYVGVVTVLIPLITAAFMLCLYAILGIH